MATLIDEFWKRNNPELVASTSKGEKPTEDSSSGESSYPIAMSGQNDPPETNKVSSKRMSQ